MGSVVQQSRLLEQLQKQLPTKSNPTYTESMSAKVRKCLCYVKGTLTHLGLKAAGVIHRFTHNTSPLTTAWDGVNWTF